MGVPRLLLALYLAVGAAGIFFGHPNPVLQVPVLVLLAPFVLFLLAWQSRSGRESFLHGWIMGAAGQAAALYWISEPLTSVGGLPLVLAIPCVLLLGAYLGLFTGLAALAMRNALAVLTTEHRTGSALPVLACGLLGGMAWAGFEVLSGWLFTGFPWLNLATALAPWPSWIQAASIIGAFGLSGLYASGACLLALSACHPAKGRIPALILAALCLLAPPAYGTLRLASVDSAPESHGNPVTVLMVQANINQNQKWEASFQNFAVNKHKNLTRLGLKKAASEGKAVDLVIWPETAMPFYFQPGDPLSEDVRAFVRRENINLAFGTLGYRRTADGRTVLFNRVQLLSGQGLILGHYDKEHLVPFGEYTPLALDFQFIRNIMQGVDFYPGDNPEALLLPLTGRINDPLADAYVPPADRDNPPVVIHGSPLERGRLALGILICYEVVFPELAQKRVDKGANLLVTVSNDAWFGRTSSPYQHLHLAAMRSVEQQRPMVRDTNTGCTAVIDAHGRISQQSGLFTESAVVATVVPGNRTTIYHWLHPLPEIVLLLGAAIMLLLPAWRRFRRSETGVIR